MLLMEDRDWTGPKLETLRSTTYKNTRFLSFFSFFFPRVDESLDLSPTWASTNHKAPPKSPGWTFLTPLSSVTKEIGCTQYYLPPFTMDIYFNP